MEFCFHTLDKQFRGIVPIKPVEFSVDKVLQILHGVLDLGREQIVGHWPYFLAHIRDQVGIVDHHLMGLLRTQIAEFTKHLIGGAEIQGVGFVTILKALGSQQNMAENLILRVQEVYIAGSHHRLAQFLPQTDDGTVKLPQLLNILGNSLFQHEHIVADGLNFQEIIERGDVLQFFFTLVLHNRLEQFAGFTGRADNQTLSVLHDLRFRHPGEALEKLQVGVRDQMVEVTQSHLVFGKENNVVGAALAKRCLPLQTHHIGIDLLQTADPLLFQHIHKPGHNQATGHGIVRRPVMVEVWQAQGVGYHIQLMLAELGHQDAGEDQGIGVCKATLDVLPFTFCPDEADVKGCVMSNQWPLSHKFQEFGKNLTNLRLAFQHLVGNAGKLRILGSQQPLRVHQSLETIHFLPVFQNNRAYFRNAVINGRKTCCLQIKGNIFPVERNVGLSTDNDTVIHIVHIITFAAVEDLDYILRPGHLWAAAPGLHRVQCVREGLDTAVVGDGNGLMPPGCRLLDGRFGAGKGIHIAHGGMQVQLHTLHALCRIFPLGQLTGHNGKGLQDSLIRVVIYQQFSLNFQHTAVFHTLQNRSSFFIFQKSADTDRGSVIGHVKIDDPGIALFQFLMLHRKDTALHDDNTHIQTHILHGHSLSLKGLTINGTGLHRRCFLFGHFPGFRQTGDYIGTHSFHSVKKGFALQIPACPNLNLHRDAKLGLQSAAHSTHTLQKRVLAVGRQVNAQRIVLPCPFGSRKAAAGHGVLRNKKLHQIVGFHTLQLVCRIHRFHCQPAQAIGSGNLPGSFAQEPLWNVGVCGKRHRYRAGFRVNVRSGDGRLRQHPQKGLRRLIVRKHIQKAYGVTHKLLSQCFNSL